MTASSIRRTPLGAALALLAVLLLFGTLSFVAGIVVGAGSDPVGQADGSVEPSGAVPSEAATPGPTPVLETISCAEPTEAFAVLCDAYAQIRADYVDEVTDEQLLDGAIRGMVEYGLEDPYSGYLPPSQYGEALDDLSGEFSGIGAEVGMENLSDPDDLASCTVVTDNCVMVIVAPLEGSPAEDAGLRPGDQILAIDGESTAGESVSSLVFVVRGEAGTDVTLTIRRGDEDLDITVTRAVIDLQEVRSEMLEDGIGYIKLTSFTSRATELFADALTGLLDQGATRIVFDLRGNPGGFINAAQGIASQFIPEGELLFTVESDGEVQEWRAESGVLQIRGRARRPAHQWRLGLGIRDRGRSAEGIWPRDARRRAHLREEHRADLERPSEWRRPAPHDGPVVHARAQLGGTGRHPAGRGRRGAGGSNVGRGSATRPRGGDPARRLNGLRCRLDRDAIARRSCVVGCHSPRLTTNARLAATPPAVARYG